MMYRKIWGFGAVTLPDGTVCDATLGPLPPECASIESQIPTITAANPSDQAAAAAELANLPVGAGGTILAPGSAGTSAILATQAQQQQAITGQWIPGVPNAVIVMGLAGLALIMVSRR